MSVPHLSPPWQLLQLCLAALQLLLQLCSLHLTAVIQYLQLLQLHLQTVTLEDTEGTLSLSSLQHCFYWNMFKCIGMKSIWPKSVHGLFIFLIDSQGVPYLSLDLRGLLLRLFELLPQGADLPDASVPAALCHGLPIKWNILLDGGVHQATVPRLGHGHVALCHDLVRAGLHLLPLCALLSIFLFQWKVDAGAGPEE